MNLEIHNALAAALRQPIYRQLRIDSKTGLASRDGLVRPAIVVIRPRVSGFSISETRRTIGIDRTAQQWVAEVEVPGLVFFDEAEDALSIAIPVPVEGRRPLLVLLASASYGYPPDQSPSSPSQAAFTFQVYSPTLRN